MLGLTKNLETPRKVLDILKKHDKTFQYYDDAKIIIINGQQISSQEFLQFLEQLRNPNFKVSRSNDILLYSLAQHTQNETEAAKRKLFKQLPGLEKYILNQPSGTRSTTSKSSAAKQLILDDTAVIAQSSAKPTKLTTTSKPKEGRGHSRKSLAVVHWNRWQKHMKRFVFFSL